MLWCPSTETKASVQYSAVPSWALPDADGMRHRPPANGRTCPEETGAKLRRCWEQKEVAGRSLVIQWHKAVRSMLCDAVPFLFLYPAWHLGLVHTTRGISAGNVPKCSALGVAASWPWPWEACGPGKRTDPLHPHPDHHPAEQTPSHTQSMAAAYRNT